MQVYVTGTQPKVDERYLPFNVTHDEGLLMHAVDALFDSLPAIDLLVYAAGQKEDGHIDERTAEEIRTQIHLGLTAPALILKKLLEKQGHVGGFIVITSTSQWSPREREPVYAASKAGLSMLAESVSLDERITKTLVVGPAALDTDFWKGTKAPKEGALSPRWVAEEVVKQWEDSYVFRMVKILREPERVEVVTTRS